MGQAALGAKGDTASSSLFLRTSLVLGEAAKERLASARVAVFGLGGVGSYAVEALARSGVGALDLIDGDIIEESNINRQLYALHSTIGQAKVDAAYSRVKDINPDCTVRVMQTFYLPRNFEPGGSATAAGDESAEEYIEGASYVVDAVDTVRAKAGIIMAARKFCVPVISCMGTGNKIDPSLLCLADIGETKVCPLARQVRRELRAKGITSGVKVVYSTEKPCHSAGETIGSVSFVPAAAGMIMAGEVVRHIAGAESGTS